MLKILGLLMLSILFLTGCGSSLNPDGDEAKTLVAEQYLREHQFNGTALIAHRGKVLLNQGFGVADVTSGRPNSAATIFPIGSITKPFTALAIMQLYERNLLDTQDRVSDYVPEFPGADQFTLHHLLSHSSGLPRDLSDHALVDDDAGVATAMAAYPGVPLAFEPGTDFQYSNLGYELLALVVERASGQSYESYLDEMMFEPLSMENSGVAISPLTDPDAATGYRGSAGTGPAVEPLHASWWKGAGGIYSTVEDLYRWEKALTEGALLGDDAWQEMHAAQSKTSSLDSQGYGYGWQVIEPQQIVWHSGDLPGYHAWLFRDLRRDLTIIALSNDDSWLDRGIDLISLYQRGRTMENSQYYPVLLVAISGTAAIGIAGAILTPVLGLRRRGWRIGRPGAIRIAGHFVAPIVIAIVLLLVALEPIGIVGSWEVLAMIAPAVARLSVSLALGAAFLLTVSASAFVQPSV